MNNIDKLIDSIWANFERFIRWVYPGALFLVLLAMSRPKAFEALVNMDDGIGKWGLVVGALVAGVIIYLLQGYVVSYIITVPLILLKWDVRQGLQVDLDKRETEPKNQPVSCLRWMVPLFARMAAATRERWNAKEIGNYLDYAWGVYHALLMTGWLTIAFFYLVAEQGSTLHTAGAWKVVTPCGLLLFGGIFTYFLLTRIRVKDP